MENLLRQRDELQAKIRELDDLAATDTEKILQAIKNQQWFFFKNNNKILMDKNTALLWANLDYFPYKKSNTDKDEYSYKNSYAEVKDLMTQKNADSWGGFNDWEIPTKFEFEKLFKNKKFPFLRTCVHIQKVI